MALQWNLAQKPSQPGTPQSPGAWRLALGWALGSLLPPVPPPCCSWELGKTAGTRRATGRCVCERERDGMLLPPLEVPWLAGGHNTACPGIPAMPGTCWLGIAPFGLLGVGRAGIRSSLGWGWQQVPLDLCLWGCSPRVAGGPGLGAGALCKAPELGKEDPGAVCFALFCFFSVVKTSSHHFILLFYQ